MFWSLSVYSLPVSDLDLYVNSAVFQSDNERSVSSYLPGTNITDGLTGKTHVEIIKSFKNSSGFYKINGTLENQGLVIISDIKIIKYYKIPSVNDTTLVCYEQNVVSCEYKSNNQLPQKSYFFTMPPSPETNIK